MKLLLRTLCLSHLRSFFKKCPIPDLNSAPTFETDSLRSAPVSQAAAIVLAAGATELSVPLRFVAGLIVSQTSKTSLAPLRTKKGVLEIAVFGYPSQAQSGGGINPWLSATGGGWRSYLIDPPASPIVPRGRRIDFRQLNARLPHMGEMT